MEEMKKRQEKFDAQARTSPEGWYFPAYTNANKLHYHRDNNRSLCGRYGTFGSDANDFSKTNPDESYMCKTCLKKLNA